MKTAILVTTVWCLASSAFAANPLLGEVELEAAGRIERNAGVWVDGQYVGFVKDLDGSDRLVLVPGTHQVLVKLIGYEDVSSTIVVEPGTRSQYRVQLQPTEGVEYPDKDATAKVRIDIEPKDAAIFVNDRYVGHVDRFNGPKGMRLEPGTYRFTIALPGYRAFDTELAVRANQTYELKTKLQKGSLDEQAQALTAGAGR